MKAIVSVMLALSVLAGVYVGLQSSTFQSSPWEQGVPFFFPSMTATDSKGNVYVVDSGTQRLMALAQDGTLLWKTQGGKRQQGFYYAVGLGMDSKDRLYICNSVPDKEGRGLVESLQIQRYNQKGIFEKSVLVLDNTGQSSDFGSYFSFFIQDDFMYYISSEGGPYTLWRCGLDGQDKRRIMEITAPSDLVSLYGTGPGKLAAVARNGKVLTMSSQGEWKPLDLTDCRKPWDIKIGRDGSFYVLDVLDRSIRLIGSDGQARTLLHLEAPGKALKAGKHTLRSGTFADILNLSPQGTISVADKENNRILVLPAQTQIPREYPMARYGTAEKTSLFLFWTIAVLGALCLLSSGILAYIFLIKRRLPLIVRQVLIFVPIIMIAQMITYNQVYEGLYKRYRNEIASTLLNAADLASRQLPALDVDALRNPSDVDSPAYESVKEAASHILAVCENTGGAAYLSIYRMEHDAVYTVYTGSGYFGVMYPYSVLPAKALDAFRDYGLSYDTYSDDWGTYMAGFAPIHDQQGHTIGLVELGIFADLLKEVEAAFLLQASIFSVVNSAVFVVIFIILTMILLRSLNPLRHLTREIAQGNMDLPVELRSRDELGHLAQDFNSMAQHLKGFIQDIRILTEASARFVPLEFIKLLGQDDLTKLHLGDQTARDMGIVFSSLTNFKRLTGHMSSQGAFNFLNSYYTSVVPLIQARGGMIDKYIGDTYMALFPSSALEALDSIRLLRETYSKYNSKRAKNGTESVSITFGLHWGKVMLGIVGEAERLEGTVISDSVNLSSRLNSLCKLYQVKAVCSETTLASAAQELVRVRQVGLGHVPDTKESMELLRNRHPFRRLDYVMVKGKSEPVMLCELLDTGPENQAAYETLMRHEQAFDWWMNGDVDLAAHVFAALASEFPDDPVAAMHAQRCAEVLQKGLPDPWNPAIKLSQK